MIGPLLVSAIDLTFDALEAGVYGIKRAQQFWRVVRPPAAPPEGAIPFSVIEHQRAQAQAGASHGTVTGPTPSKGKAAE
jgi:hypothetical protein